ncbi:hypothetical protein POM88_021240 [Heracleum sosnowskyi]|uniref:Peptidase S8/S53 domain-containing protein n=1 Tax=Heracleum sosnowskyi TaxID=360622 RepID=A0AAD8MNS5_9APIA|nr:hypothetical protein POM88_021240 [Heracleum sosnowskyi]
MDAVNCVLVDRMHLSDATRWLKDLLDGEAGFADNLSDDAVEILLQIFDNDKSVVWKYIDDDIQSLAIHILSRALSREKFHMYLKCVVPSLVKLFSNSSIELQIAGVIALTRLADTCPKYIPVRLEQNALREVQKIAIIKPRDSELVEWVTKFLAVICYRGLPQEKVKEALTISERLLQINSLGDRNIVSRCYALQYLTYGNHVPIEGKAWEKLIKRLRAYIRNPTATIRRSATSSGYKPAPIVALFSSRGPSYLSHNLLKQDITAPGVNIIAAWSKMNTKFALPGQAPPDYVVISGTSMATPHIAVVAALTNIGCSSEF